MNIKKWMCGVVAAPLLLAGCGDYNPFAATLPTSATTITVFSLTGTPPAYPSGLNTYGQVATRVDGNANFDIAFDINSDGKAVLYPVKLIVSSIGGDRIVGLRKVTGTFDEVVSAPTGTYQPDSAVVASVGDVVVVEANHASSGDVCYLNVSPNIYSKISVDSVNVEAHTIVMRTVLDPNCGFRSFATGIPTK